MSAYQLTHEKYQLIADFLYTQAISQNSMHGYAIRAWLGATDIEEIHICDSVKCKVRHLYNLNRLSLCVRYGEIYDTEDGVRYNPNLREINSLEAIETLKSLRYQCMEYMVSDTKLYAELCSLIARLCEDIFNKGE